MSVDTHLLNIIKLISNVTDAFTTALFLSDEKSETLSLKAYYTLSKHVIPNASFGYGDGMVGWVARNSKPLIVNQFDHDTKTLQFYSIDEDIKSFMAVPLPGGKGVLSVDSKHKYIFTEKSQKVLYGFTDLIVHELEISGLQAKERLYDRILDLHYQSDRLAHNAQNFGEYLLNVLTLCLSFTRAEMGFFATLADGREGIYRVQTLIGTTKTDLQKQSFHVEKGLVGWVFRKEKPLVLEKVRQMSSKTYLFAPDEPFKGFGAFLGIPCTFSDGPLSAVMGFTAYGSCTWKNEEVEALFSVGQRIMLAEKYFSFKVRFSGS